MKATDGVLLNIMNQKHKSPNQEVEADRCLLLYP